MGMSDSSRKKLATCHPDIVELVEALAVDEDIIVLEGARSLARQKELIASGASKLKDAKNGAHVVTKEKPLSDAIDVIPNLPEWKKSKIIDWKNTAAFHGFAERVLKKAHALSTKLRWGGDWDGDGDYTDQQFHDLVHFERVP